MKENWEIVIGLEIHAQLATKSKLFSASSTEYGVSPNTQANLIDLAMPGVLPVLNKEAVVMALKFGLAINAEISEQCVFARKNYFYPDLPKGYQISQFDKPIVGRGEIDIEVDGKTKIIGITRAHLEEDAGKSLHENFIGLSGIDLNRAGTPLLEIVSEPDIRSINEAIAYTKKIHNLLQYLEICDGNMQEGSFRCDANVSVKPFTQQEFGTRTELKNINSFKYLEKAIDYEINRQIKRLEQGYSIVQETRLYDADKNQTFSMRSKEEANDYRYFPDPDLLPVIITKQQLKEIKDKQTELPDHKRQRFATQYGLSTYDINILIVDKKVADYFEIIVKKLGVQHAKLAANWVNGNLAGALNNENIHIDDSPVSATMLIGLLENIIDNSISSNIAKQVFEFMWAGEGDAQQIIKAKNLSQITNSSAIAEIIDNVIKSNPQQVTDYKSGKDKLFGFFVGQVMKETKGQANPVTVNEILKQKLMH